MRVTLSIIVPVYKVESYLHDCIHSILEQSFEDFELILVDDESPDNCGLICEEYAKQDRRVKVIHQPNGGLSAARNSGIAIAEGQYLTFIDSDDTIQKDTLAENMKLLLANSNIDLLEYPIYVYYGSEEEYIWIKESQYISGVDNIFISWIEQRGYTHAYACNKIYKRELFDEIQFPVGKSFEDVYTIPDILKKVNHLYISNKGLYYYYWRETSISALPSYKKKKDFLDANLVIWKSLYRYPISKNALLAYYLFISNIVIDLLGYKENDAGYKEYIFKELSLNSFSLKDLLKIDISKRDKFKNVSLITMGLRVHCKIYNLLHKLTRHS